VKLRAGSDVHELLVRSSAEGEDVLVDGERVGLQVSETAPGVFVCRRGPARETFHCVRDGLDVLLFWRGHAYRLFPEETRAPVVSGVLESPMPGKVTAVHVAPGTAVTRGQELLVIEAMKMENAVRAPRDGIVKAVTVKAGDMASAGVVLVELE
jgi:3-methylcrotonyl-CoA carboxylase alpha subunit